MLIKRFSRLKNGMYRIFFEESSLDIHEDLILKYELLLKKEVSDDLLILLKNENLKYQVYNIALKELQKRLRSEKELCDILQKKEISNDCISDVISLLRKQGYLDDSLYVKSFVHDRILLSLDGPLKIQNDLLEKGISSDFILEELNQFTEDLEKERVEKIVQKNLKSNRKSLIEFRLKMQQLLGRLGYHNSIISFVLSDVSFDDQIFYEREYDKLYRRLSSKYQGAELEYKIRQRLYQKGFRS